MFDSIGRSLDHDRTRRSFWSVLIVGGATGLLLGAFLYEVSTLPLPPAERVTYRETGLDMLEQPDAIQAPQAPPVAQRKGSGEEARAGVEDEPEEPEKPEEPDEAPDDVKELSPQKPSYLILAERDRKRKGEAKARGTADKTVKAPVGKGSTQGLFGGDREGPAFVKYGDSRLRKSSDPIYPRNRSIRALCVARVLVGLKGRPTRIDVRGCDSAFINATRTAMTQWRWAKPTVDGVPREIITEFNIQFEPSY